MSRLRLRLLFAAFTLVIVLMTTSSGAQEAPVAQTTPAPSAEQAAPKLRNNCAKLYSARYQRGYAREVYRRKTISNQAREKMTRLRRCQKSDRAERSALKYVKHLKKQRAYRQKIARMGVKGIAYDMLRRRGALDQFGCLVALFQRESGWNVYADNPTSDAYGIPQALPGSKMGPGWQSNPYVQIRWGINYTYARYGGPCAADAFQRRNNYY